MRQLSPGFRAALFAEMTKNDAIALITIVHSDLPQPLRISSHADDVFAIDPMRRGTLSRGVEYEFIDFEMTLPEDADGTPPAFEIRLSNIGREMVALIKSTSEPAAVTIEVVSRETPDLVEAEFPDFDLTSADYDEATITLGLGIDALSTEPYPADSFTPAGFGGLF